MNISAHFTLQDIHFSRAPGSRLTGSRLNEASLGPTLVSSGRRFNGNAHLRFMVRHYSFSFTGGFSNNVFYFYDGSTPEGCFSC